LTAAEFGHESGRKGYHGKNFALVASSHMFTS